MEFLLGMDLLAHDLDVCVAGESIKCTSYHIRGRSRTSRPLTVDESESQELG
jgi:hypothetical protein